MISPYNQTTTVEQVLHGRDLSGKCYLITGGNSGLGFECARALAAHGARILITTRDPEKAAQAMTRLRERVPGAQVQAHVVDLASLASVHTLADRLHAQAPKLDGILANAGIMAIDEARTADGFERQFGTNHLGHFVLVNRIADLIAPGGRLVMVSSGAHRLHDVDLQDPNFERKPYDRWDAYGQSKSANALFALAFDHRWKPHHVRAFAVAPGIITDTNLHHHLHEEHFAVLRSRQFTDKLPRKSLGQGAATLVFALVHPLLEGEGGRFLEDCSFAQVNPDTSQADGVIPWVLDPAHAEKVWELSEALVGERFPPPGEAKKEAAAGGLGANRLPSSNAMYGKALDLHTEDGASVHLAFDQEGGCAWEELPGLGLPASGKARVDVVEVAQDTWFIDLLFDSHEKQTVTLALHGPSRRALFVATTMGECTPAPGRRVQYALTTKFRQRFTPATLAGGQPTGQAPAPTRELIGTRALYVYGGGTVYEHLYLNSGWYAYNSISGPRRGDAGCDEVTAYKLAEHFLVLAWREVLIDLAAVFIYNMQDLHTTGKAWGTPGGEPHPCNIAAGASIVPLSRTSYPEGMEPA